MPDITSPIPDRRGAAADAHVDVVAGSAPGTAAVAVDGAVVPEEHDLEPGEHAVARGPSRPP
jgi:hypothetical protein